ncbi:GntR family transcriptional regulator [Rhodopseudomonas sp. HC1]|uniref:GntR family transcriptional regulator n=1 Tax=Rhodopseudomonas infernalis TaxID=2897386 RepID=UPI001EE7F109|nr:GntR family transcriptional regulator [Rhodopseudomonas infernalis]MCG6204279.1 GntR family transcriptional regulator [Rhodopseudomonas infernalis]
MTEHTNKSEQVYDVIERMITFQELKPGQMVSEVTLMEATGFGRTPVREALQRLAWERMVEIHPRKGAFIPLISVEVQLKLLELRRVVEEFAVRTCVHRATSVQKQMMLELAREFDEVAEADDVVLYGDLLKRVHQITVAAAQNEYLTSSMAPLQSLSRRFWFANISDRRKELRAASQRHSATLRAISEGDEEAAAAASLALNDYLTEFAYRTLRGADARIAQKQLR